VISGSYIKGVRLRVPNQRGIDTYNTWQAQQAQIAAQAQAASTQPLLDYGYGSNDWSDSGGGWSSGDVEYIHNVLSQPGGASSGNAPYVSPTFTALGLQNGPLVTDVRGGFDSFGNSTANVPEYNLGSAAQAVGGAAVAPFVEWGNQVGDDFAALGGATGGFRSTFAQQITAGNYGSAALAEAGMVAGIMPVASAGETWRHRLNGADCRQWGRRCRQPTSPCVSRRGVIICYRACTDRVGRGRCDK
jgi:hypothetical protein